MLNLPRLYKQVVVNFTGIELKIIGVIVCLSIFSLEAWIPPTDIALSVGARRDSLSSEVISHLPANSPPRRFDKLKIKDIKLIELGVNGTLALSNEACPFYTWWLNQFYLRGSAFAGKTINQSRFRQDINNIPATTLPIINLGRSKGFSRDYEFAIGWYYPINDNLSVAPLLGYGNHYLSLRVDDLKNPVGSRDGTPRQFNGSRFRSTFHGPWLGLDIFYAWDYWTVWAEYSCCWVFWHGSFRAPSNVSRLNTDHREASDGLGDQLALHIGYTFWECWTIGLEIYSRNFRVDDGSRRPEAGFANVSQFDSAEAQWQSFGAHIDLGLSF